MIDFLFEFPFVQKPNVKAIDRAVRNFAVWADGFLSAISSFLIGMINTINWVLSHIPWFLLIFIVFYWLEINRKDEERNCFCAHAFLIGVVGYWNAMCLTLSIVITGVIISLIIGFPIGIIISGSERANNIVRPILDTMQTMPVFVYLIPAMLFFGMNNASGVIATVIYSVVPVIRLTSLGIQQVDKEVVEAARSFGSNRFQLLFKVLIPQAKPTIMTGVNQTLMMAMAMVVTCSMIGTRGLGIEVLNAVNRIEIGRGIIAGSSVVALAVILDRITQGWAKPEKTVETSKTTTTNLST